MYLRLKDTATDHCCPNRAHIQPGVQRAWRGSLFSDKRRAAIVRRDQSIVTAAQSRIPDAGAEGRSQHGETGYRLFGAVAVPQAKTAVLATW